MESKETIPTFIIYVYMPNYSIHRCVRINGYLGFYVIYMQLFFTFCVPL